MECVVCVFVCILYTVCVCGVCAVMGGGELG